MSVNKLQRYTTKGVHPQYIPRPDPDGYWVEYDKVAPLEARVRELEAEVEEAADVRDMVRRGWADCEQKLADANALLREMNHKATVPYTDEGNDLKRRVEAHLAGQPAAPSRTPFPPRSVTGRPELTEEFPDDAAPSRTEAEQAVLDASAAIIIDNLVQIAERNGKRMARWARAELARRNGGRVRARRGLK